MSQFYIDVDDGEQFSHDLDGTICDDDEAARKEAIRRLSDVAHQILPDGNMRTFRADLRNNQRVVIFRATLSLRAQWVEPPKGS